MKARIAQQVIGLAEYYDKTLSENQIEMFVEDLSSITIDQLKYAIKKYRSDPSNSFFPLPSKLISLINPHMNEKDIAQDVSSIIISSVSKCGYTNPEQAKKNIGELGWEVVSRMGGWKHLCETLNSENEGMFRAQIRELSITVAKKSARGELDLRPELPAPHGQFVNKLIGETFK